MAISIDWGTRVITVPQSDLTLISGSLYELDTDWFRLQLKDLEDSELGMVNPDTHIHKTTSVLSGITYARIFEIINGYTVTFENGLYAVNLKGTNNNIIDVTNRNSVGVGSNNSAGLIDVDVAGAVWDEPINGTVEGSFGEAAKQVSLQGHIHVDVAEGVAGTAHPLGTQKDPVNNIADAVTIGLANGITLITVAEDVTILATDNVDGFHIMGAHATKSQITVQAGASTDFTQFSNCYLTGALDGWVVVRDSMIEDLTGVEGIFHNVMINPGEITLGGIRASHFLSCYSGVPGHSTPALDFNGSGPTCAFRGYNGGIKLENKTGPEAVSIDMGSGQIIVDDTVTNGPIVLRGPGEWTNKASYTGGAAVTDLLIKGSEVGKLTEAHYHRRVWDSVGNTITIFEDDGITPKHIFDTNADLSDINPQ